MAFVSTDPVPAVDLKRSVQAALSSPAFDGGDTPVENSVGAFYGNRTVIKLQHRWHETLHTVHRLERLRELAGIRAPRLLDSGTVDTPSGRFGGRCWSPFPERRVFVRLPN